MGSTKKERTWRSGPPPHIGWWNASLNLCEGTWRWWDGVKWSQAAYPDMSAELAASQAESCKFSTRYIKWSDYWPEGARVPRVKP